MGLSLREGPAHPHHTAEPLLRWEQLLLQQKKISAGQEGFRRRHSKPTCISLWTAFWRCFSLSIVAGRSMYLARSLRSSGLTMLDRYPVDLATSEAVTHQPCPCRGD